MFYLSPESPQLNPHEEMDGDLKQAVTREAPARSKPQINCYVIGHMRRLSQMPARIRSFFGH